MLAAALSSTLVYAASAPPCADVPDRICDFYASHNDQRFFETGHGTFVTNALFHAPPKPPAPTNLTPSFGSEAVVGELMDILDVPTIRAARTKMVLGLTAKTIFDETSERVTVPWPLDAAKPTVKEVDRELVTMSMRDQLGPKRMERLRRFVNETRNRLEIEKHAQALATVDEGDRLTRERFATIFADPVRVAARQAEVRALFTRARADVERVVTGGRPEAEWSADERNMVTRVRAFEPKLLTPAEGDADALCANLKVNAFNVGGTHQLNVCPAAAWQPDGNLYEIFGHEITHNIDLCTLSNDFAVIDRAKLKAASEDARFNAPARHRLREFYDLQVDHVDARFDAFLDDPRVKPILVSMGAYKVVAPALDHRPAFWKDLAPCVAKRMGYREATPARREEFLRQFHENLEDFGGLDEEGRRAAEIRLRRYAEAKPDCALEGQHQRTHLNEGLADVVAAVLREKWMSEHPPHGETEKMLGFVAGPMTCRDRDLSIGGNDLSPGNTVGSLGSHASRIDDEHPASFKRVTIETDLPGLAVAAGCTRAEGACFDHLSLVKAKGGSAGPAGAGADR